MEHEKGPDEIVREAVSEGKETTSWKQVIPGVHYGSKEDELPPNLEEMAAVGKASAMAGALMLRIQLAGLPLATLQTHRFSRWQEQEELAEAFEYAQQFVVRTTVHPFLAFAGPPGTGKTHLALAIAWDWLEQCGRSVAYWHVEGLLDELRRGYAQDRAESGSETYLTLNYAKKCSLLVLDDLGAERATDWSTAKLDEIVDFRYLNRLPMVVTLNVAPADLAPRLADRLFEGRVFVLDAPSYRRRKKEG